VSRARFDRLPPSRRDEILDVAARHFAAHGYEGASYNQILAEAGLSKSSAYYLLENKAELYAAVLERACADLPLPGPLDPYWEGVEAWLRASAAFLVAHPQAGDLLRGFAALPPASVPPEVEAALVRALVGAIEWLVARGIAAGAVRDDLPAEVLVGLVSAVLAVLDRTYLPTSDPPVPVYLDTLKRLLAP
jgi:TetR/AcrR family transcriptional regulator, transcriptional repressor of aconitase